MLSKELADARLLHLVWLLFGVAVSGLSADSLVLALEFNPELPDASTLPFAASAASTCRPVDMRRTPETLRRFSMSDDRVK